MRPHCLFLPGAAEAVAASAKAVIATANRSVGLRTAELEIPTVALILMSFPVSFAFRRGHHAMSRFTDVYAV